MNKAEFTPDNCTGSFLQLPDGTLVLESPPTKLDGASSKKKGFGQTKYVAPETAPDLTDASTGDKPVRKNKP